MRMILLVILILVNSCATIPSNSPTLKESQKITKHIDVIQEERAESLPIPTQKNYSNFYLSKPNFIYTAGVPIERIINILKPINPEYFEGVSRIEFINTNKFISSSKDGWYYADIRSIRIFVDYESDEFLRRVVMHESKHHYCYQKSGNPEPLHLGCFLDTPIDKEYGFIK